MNKHQTVLLVTIHTAHALFNCDQCLLGMNKPTTAKENSEKALHFMNEYRASLPLTEGWLVSSSILVGVYW